MRRLLFVALFGLATVAAAEERVVFPVLSPSFAGAHGAIWRTRLVVHNAGATELQLAPNINCQNLCPGFEIIAPGELRELSWQRPGTQILEVGRFATLLEGDVRDLSFHLVAEDTTRLNSTAGTELPVVRENEFLPGRVRLPGVVANDAFRHNLRIYTTGDAATVTVRSFEVRFGVANQVVREQTVALATTAPTAYVPTAQLPLDGFLPTSDATYVIEVAASANTPLWAFVTTTNNATQHITTITPQ